MGAVKHTLARYCVMACSRASGAAFSINTVLAPMLIGNSSKPPRPKVKAKGGLPMKRHTKSIQDFDTNEAAKLNRPAWPKTNGMVLAEGKLIPFQQAFTRERMRQLRLYPDHSAPIFAFHNSGGLRFREQTAEWGLESRAIHHGAALADLDNDGDLDLAVNTLNSPCEVWINRGGAPRIAVELRGKPPNTAAVGAKVTLHGGAVPSQLEEVTLGGKYLSGSQTRLVFAPGARNADLRLEVAWPSGAQTVLRAVQPNQLYEIDESQESQE